MVRKIVMAMLLVVEALTLLSCSSTVKFKSMDISNGYPQILTGNLMKPKGDGPFPAIVMLHGCDGPKEELYSPWAHRLRKWGYVTLRVDSLGPRGVSHVCTPERGFLCPPFRRALDAYGAKSHLARLPFVDGDRIGLMGWSHGGTTVLRALTPIWERVGLPFRAGVAFYPWCHHIPFLDAPLLILIGEKDDWTPAYRCESLPKLVEHGVTLKIYPGAYHSFDHDVPLHLYMGHWVGRNDKAAADAQRKVKEFLDKHLK